MFTVDGYTKQLAIIGNPVDHSFSPEMHNYISEITNNNYVYTAWCVNDIQASMQAVKALNISGVNVTAPFKEKVIPYLDEVDEQAQIFGSVNTVVNQNGRLKGYNTDAEGFYMSLLKNGIDIRDRQILIIGAGGVVRPVVTKFIYEGAKSITVVNRNEKRVLDLKAELYKTTKFKIETQINDADFDVVINTTSAGMAPQKDILPTAAISSVSNLDFINDNTAVVDMIYNPRETLFLKEAKQRGAKTVNGLGMLIYQGILAYELFTGVSLPKNIYEMIKENVFDNKEWD